MKWRWSRGSGRDGMRSDTRACRGAQRQEWYKQKYAYRCSCILIGFLLVYFLLRRDGLASILISSSTGKFQIGQRLPMCFRCTACQDR